MSEGQDHPHVGHYEWPDEGHGNDPRYSMAAAEERYAAIGKIEGGHKTRLALAIPMILYAAVGAPAALIWGLALIGAALDPSSVTDGADLGGIALAISLVVMEYVLIRAAVLLFSDEPRPRAWLVELVVAAVVCVAAAVLIAMGAGSDTWMLSLLGFAIVPYTLVVAAVQLARARRLIRVHVPV